MAWLEAPTTPSHPAPAPRKQIDDQDDAADGPSSDESTADGPTARRRHGATGGRDGTAKARADGTGGGAAVDDRDGRPDTAYGVDAGTTGDGAAATGANAGTAASTARAARRGRHGGVPGPTRTAAARRQ